MKKKKLNNAILLLLMLALNCNSGIPITRVSNSSQQNHDGMIKFESITDSTDLYVDIYEVTNDNFIKFANRKGIPLIYSLRKKNFRAPMQPALGMSGLHAIDYCKELNKRLPTYNEWLKLCRYGIAGPFVSGNELDYKMINCNNHYGKALEVDNIEPSAIGCVGLTGNAKEWVLIDEDYIGDSYASDEAYMVGGSWSTTPEWSMIDASPKTGRIKDGYIAVCFRCVREVRK